MNNKELKNLILQYKKENNNQFHISKHKELLNDIIEQTNFLNENTKIPERIYCILNNITSQPKCYCGNNLEFNFKTYKYKTYCCRKCQDISEYKKEKAKKTSLERYGTENPMQNPDIAKKSVKNNNYIKMAKTFKENCLAKYGVSHPMKLEKVKNKIKKTSLERYGTENPMQNPDIMKKCLINNGHESNFEREINSYIINDLKLETSIHNFNIIKGKEIDIFIKEYNIAIECNGEYWHREANNKDKNYHLSKTITCENKGIYLIQIFEQEWILYKDKIKKFLVSVINNKELDNIIIDNEIILDRRFFNLERIRKKFNNFDILIEPPTKMIYENHNLIYESKFFESNSENTIWNCGKIIIRQSAAKLY